MIYKLAILFSVLFILFILNLVRRGKLDEKYSILWVIFAVAIFIIAIYPESIIQIANWFNVYYPPALLLLAGVVVVGAYIVHITVVVTKQNKMIIKLTQELAIVKKETQSD